MPASRSEQTPRRTTRDSRGHTLAARWRAAVHEAGHAVACVRLRRRVGSVSLPMNAHTMGQIDVDSRVGLHPRRARDPARAVANVMREVVIGWAGYVAEQMVFGRAQRAGLPSDATMITRLLGRVARGKRERNGIGRFLLRECRDLLATERKTIERVARALFEHGRLSGAELRRLT